MAEQHMSTRREFLQKGLVILAAAPTVPAFLNRTVMAMANPLDTPLTQQPSGRDGPILVVVQLSGGNDGLSSVIPYADDAYHRARPAIRHDADAVLKINHYLGLHPNMAGMKSLLDDGRLSIVQGVGYPNPNRSHFRAMDIWHTARPDQQNVPSGWLGRYFDNTCNGCDPHVGVSIGSRAPVAMQGESFTPVSFDRPETYRYQGGERERYEQLLKEHEAEMAAADELAFLQRTAMSAQLSSDQVLAAVRGHRPTVTYPGGGFAGNLRTIAAMIRAGLSTRVYYASLGGFDTHAGQKWRHDALMQQLSGGLAAFWADLKEQRNDQRVLVLTFSEFGRRVQQNASSGTDHGAAAPMFLMGTSLREGVVGAHPSLTDLYQGDLRFGIDFRSVYATVLEQWLGTPSLPILGARFPTLPIFRG